MSLPVELLHHDSSRTRLQKAKPLLQNPVLESLLAYETDVPGSLDDGKVYKRFCGICISGALSETRTPFLEGEPDTPDINKFVRATNVPKFTCPPGMSIQQTDDDDGRVWTAILRFLVKPRTQEGMVKLLDQLGDTSACPCSKTEDTGVLFPKQNVVISLHYLNEAGRGLIKSYFHMGHFPPSTWITSSTEDRQRGIPIVLASLRGREPSTLSACISRKPRQAKYLPPVTELDKLPDKPLGVILILVMMDVLAYITHSRASLPFYKGRHLWPYSPRELLLSVKDEALERSNTRHSDALEACASTVIGALEQWSALIPKTITVTLATMLTEMCGTLVVPHLMRSSFSTTVVTSLARDVIRDSMDSLQKVDNSDFAYAHLSSRRDIAQWILNALAIVSNYFTAMTFRPDIPHEDRESISRPIRLKLLQLFTMMTYLLNDPRFPNSMKSSKRWKEVLEMTHTLCYYHLRKVLKEYPVPTNGLLLVAVHPQLLKKTSFTYFVANVAEHLDCDDLKLYGNDATENRMFFLKTLPPLWKRMYCFAPGCPKSIHLVSADYKACSGCGIARYCSRVCQKADWKRSGDRARQIQHSRVFGILSHFRQSALVEGNCNAGEIVLEDENCILLCDWYKSLVQSVDIGGDNPTDMPSWKGMVKNFMQFTNTFMPPNVQLVSNEDMAAFETASWEDFPDV
ncbi:hypothetical protein CPB83DRAFT_899483 [Crepidotus variabilis]|uniref:MYND-type domain-containing protein n=1 Tax=Crepidotus variabilis TaxID=179855 RepID=A0A9P6JJ69_9AGAR|nr:hypothetical protein CPB83DRAFT_899483 [Crepidotus variabilis]